VNKNKYSNKSKPYQISSLDQAADAWVRLCILSIKEKKLINQNNNKASLYIDAVNIGKAVNYKCSRAKSGNYKLEVL